MKTLYTCLLLGLLVFTGCAGLEAPSPQRFIPPWSGASPLHLGDSKDYVREQWGEPEYIKDLGHDEVGLVKEEWVYAGRKLPVIEIEPKMLVKGDNLIFAGRALVGYKEKDAE
ncbi:MAG: hypothetical protein PHV77_02420 [Candidatus Omnitrophica bacterium]|jgi:hypothetical protein|nr:hypothetical protein [Candidatus Omnitrophota bacterium]